MVIATKYRLNITDNISENMQFMFDNTVKIKELLKYYYSHSGLKVEVYKVVYELNMSTGVISSTQTRITTDL